MLFVLYVSSLLVCHMIVKNGVKQSGKVVVVTALLPFVFLLLLLVRGLFLDGVSDGLAYLFKPKWEKLFTWSIWVDALVQVFYQLSIAMGAIVNMSSMKPLR